MRDLFDIAKIVVEELGFVGLAGAILATLLTLFYIDQVLVPPLASGSCVPRMHLTSETIAWGCPRTELPLLRSDVLALPAVLLAVPMLLGATLFAAVAELVRHPVALALAASAPAEAEAMDPARRAAATGMRQRAHAPLAGALDPASCAGCGHPRGEHRDGRFRPGPDPATLVPGPCKAPDCRCRFLVTAPRATG